ncbi:MAG: hypothetical protein D6731_18320 [Planctomycetota bacterium]|nr:MAG: hypothetical protein D6731_18320 [Planctomycetota bacterium]
MSPLDRLLQFKLRVGRIARIDVYAHWTLLLLGAYLLYSFRSDLKLGLLVELGLWGSIFLHELGHCWAARRVGGEADEIVLWPLGGLALTREAFRPWPKFFTAAMGPAVNALLLVVALPLYLMLGGDLAALLPGSYPSSPALGIWFLYTFVYLNGLLLLLNLLPAFPLDGGRMFQAALWPRLGFRRSLQWAIFAAYASAALIAVYAVFVAQSFLLGCVALFVVYGALQERARLRYGLYEEVELLGGSASPWSPGFSPEPDEGPRPSAFRRWRERRRRRREALEARRLAELRERLDEVLAKVSRVGMDGLTREERAFLERASKELRKQRSR